MTKVDDINNELINFISLKAGIDQGEVNYGALIEDDLGVTGEDTEQLMVEFSKLFKVDIANFDFGKYFNEEPFLSIFLTLKIKL